MQRRQTTLSDVAAYAGVSPATVSRVLAGNYPVAAATRERVLAAVQHFDYVVNVHARALVHARSGIVGLVLGDVADPFFSEIVRGAQSVVAGAGRLTVICNTGGDPEQELSYLNLLRTHRADAVILIGAGSRKARARAEVARHADGLARQGSVLVLCGRPLPARDCAAGVVDLGNRAAVALAVEHLLALGHRRILYLSGPRDSTTTADRLRGLRDGVSRTAGAQVTVRPGDLSRAAGERLVAEVLAERLDVTAVLASNDLMAIGALAALRRAGRSVPGEVSVIGVDDIPIAADVMPALTSVHLPLVELGGAAARLALAAGEPEPGERRVSGTPPQLPDPYLVLRDSTGPAHVL